MMSFLEDDAAHKIAELFMKYKNHHRISYPRSSIDFDALNITERIIHAKSPKGRGHFSDVYPGVLDKTVPIAVKVLRLPVYDSYQDHLYETVLRRFFRELNHWNDLRHVNVARMLGFSLDQGNLGLVSLWYPNGNLVQYLQVNPNASKPDLALDIAEGVQYLHTSQQQLIHGDLKGLNVFVSEVGIACLGDFGISKEISDFGRKTGFTTSSDIAGTIPWMAPELLNGTKISFASDVYASAGVFLEIWCPGKSPYDYITSTPEIIMAKHRDELPDRRHYPGLESEDLLWDLLSVCWRFNPAERPSIESVVQELYLYYNRIPRVVANVAIRPMAGPPEDEPSECPNSCTDNDQTEFSSPVSSISTEYFTAFEVIPHAEEVHSASGSCSPTLSISIGDEVDDPPSPVLPGLGELAPANNGDGSSLDAVMEQVTIGGPSRERSPGSGVGGHTAGAPRSWNEDWRNMATSASPNATAPASAYGRPFYPFSSPQFPTTSASTSTTPSLSASRHLSSTSERDRLLASVAQHEPRRALEVTELLLSLPKMERAKCMFNPEYLKTKIAEASYVLDVNDEEETVADGYGIQSSHAVAIRTAPLPGMPPDPHTIRDAFSEVASRPSAVNPQHVETLTSITKLPVVDILKLARSPDPEKPGSPLYRANPKVVRAADDLIDSLVSRPDLQQKAVMGDKLFRLFKAIRD